MQRNVAKELLRWNEKDNRKPLILLGSRQVGKTTLLKNFALANYKDNYIHINLMRSQLLRQHFNAPDFTPEAILNEIKLSAKVRLEPGRTLLVIDDIQESNNVPELLDYLQEAMPELAVVAAGSMFGMPTSAATENSRLFANGRGNVLKVRPLTFAEFLRAVGQVAFADMIEGGELEALSHHIEALSGHLRRYLIVGGMPGAVEAFVETDGDFGAVREVQDDILSRFDNDFLRYAPAAMQAKARLLWESIPRQLCRENHKFFFSAIKSGARAREYEAALEWLARSGRIRPCYWACAGKMPLKAYRDAGSFKVYFNDVGLLGAMSGLEPSTILHSRDLIANYKGLLIEQYAMQEMVAHGLEPYYWERATGNAAIEFLVQRQEDIVPIEVKGTVSPQAKNLKVYWEEYQPAIAIRSTVGRYAEGEKVKDVPLCCFAAGLKKFVCGK